MIRSIKTAYGAGWRAGMAEPTLDHHPDGTKTLARVPNPCRGIFRRIAWDNGYHNGVMERCRRSNARYAHIHNR